MRTKQILFEVSWEVCNKVGGIYTVIRSKLAESLRAFDDNYFLIGPLFDYNPEFSEDVSPESIRIRKKLKQFDINVLVGRWKVPESPKVILVAYKDFPHKDKLLYQLWEDFGVDSMTAGWDYHEPVLFGTVAGKTIEILSGLFAKD